MDKDRRAKAHKLGVNRKELATRPRKRTRRFSESKDIHEDRGVRLGKMGGRKPC